MKPTENAAQLADLLREKIELGELAPGERLVPIRTLALEVGLNRNTVASAYKQLQQAGLVEAHGRNMRVALRPFLSTLDSRRDEGPEITDLSFNNPDPELLPDLSKFFPSITTDRVGLYGDDPDNRELLRLLEVRHAGLGFPRGVGMVIPGTTDEMGSLLRMYHSPGDKVAVENPGYMKLIYLVRASGLKAIPMALDEEGPLPDAVETALKAGVKSIFFTPRAQNPCGVSTSEKRASEIRILLRSYPDVLVVEDEHAGPLLTVPAHTCIEKERHHWAVLHSVAKYLGPDLRVGAMFASERTFARSAAERESGGQWVSHLLQQLTLTLLKAPDRDIQDKRAGDVYAERRQSFEAALEAHGIPFIKGQGLNVWIPTIDAERIAGRMYRRGWNLRTGTEFCLGGLNGLRVTISQLDTKASGSLAADLATLMRSPSTAI